MSVLVVISKFLLILALCDATLNIFKDNGYSQSRRDHDPCNWVEISMTMKQIRSTGKMMRKTCQPKNNVPDEKIDGIGEGVFIEEKEVMCYIACIMKMANTIKNGKLNFEAAMKQADLLLPDEIKEPAKAAITACRKVADSYKDVCESSFHVTKCIFKENPSIFYFP